LAEAWAETLRLPLLTAKEAPDAPPETALSVRFMKQYHAVPVGEAGPAVQLATADPGDPYIAHAVELACGRPVNMVVAARADIDDLIERWYGTGRSALGTIVEGLGEGGETTSGDDDIERLRDLASEAPVIRLVNLLIQRAVEARASDIHIEPFENRLKVRYRIDGVLHEVEAPPASSTAAVISRIKIMARMNIAERRLPQDGRIMLRVQGKELDLRVSAIPTSFGESVVMRILDRGNVILDFDSLGFDEQTLPSFLHVLEQPHGILLVTGPTGSGKTTTLYTALAKINTPDRKIITVEDPVEYQIEGINQMQVKPQIGLDFAGALRSIVRQDPDVIMIGEMRDLETCKIAIQSALTGHLVLSTLHTNSAAGGLTRLLDMGVEDYLIASTVNAIVAQRLVRRLDPATAEAYEPLPEMVAELGLDQLSSNRPLRLYRPTASAENPSGFRGRLAIIEQLTMNDALRRLLMQHADASDIERAARQSGMRTMYEDGLRKALAGLTTVEEVLRVTQEG
jgi:general secretion pathway protein E